MSWKIMSWVMFISRQIKHLVFFFKLYVFILLTSTLVPGINYFVVTTHPLHQLHVQISMCMCACQAACCHELRIRN